MTRLSLRLRSGHWEFTPAWLPTLAMLIVLALLLKLGFWQLQRAEEKRERMAQAQRGSQQTLVLTAANAATLPRYQHVRLQGAYDNAHQVLLDSMASQDAAKSGMQGYRVLTPLNLADGGIVLIDRGWVPLGATRQQLPDISVSEQSRSLDGLLDELPRPGVRAGDAGVSSTWPQVLNYPRENELRALFGPTLQARIVLLNADQPDGFERHWQINAGFGPERHVGYAVQWFGLATALLIIFIVVNFRKLPAP